MYSGDFGGRIGGIMKGWVNDASGLLNLGTWSDVPDKSYVGLGFHSVWFLYYLNILNPRQ